MLADNEPFDGARRRAGPNDLPEKLWTNWCRESDNE
jgi:hypothetical protein